MQPSKKTTLGAIYREAGKNRRPCLDGTFSDAPSRGACTKHRGLAANAGKPRKAPIRRKAKVVAPAAAMVPAPAPAPAPPAAMVPKAAPAAGLPITPPPVSSKDFRYFFHKRNPFGPIPKGTVIINFKEERMYIRFEPQENERDQRSFERNTLSFFKKKGFKLNEKTGLWERKISPKKPTLANKIISFVNEQLGTKIPTSAIGRLPYPYPMRRRAIGGSAVLGAIVTKSTAFTQCADGTYSTAKKYPCRTRGGVAKTQRAFFKTGGKSDACLSRYGFKYADTYLVPLDQITTDEARFQNRFTAFSSDSAGKIVAAVKAGRFNWGLFDPVILLKNSAYPGKYVVLSGHSRTAAFRKLAAQKASAEGRGFAAIPAKIIETDLSTAKDIALNSNTLATPETVIERAAYYRDLIERGTRRDEVKTKVQATELKNWVLVWSLTYLNPRGKTMAALTALQGKDLTSNKNLEVIASWIGQTREAFPELSDMHEDEMFDFLRMEYGKSFKALRDFQTKIRTVIQQKSSLLERFKPDTPLNLFATTVKSSYQLAYDAQEREIKDKIRELERDIDKTTRALVARMPKGISESEKVAQLDRVLNPKRSALKTQQLKLAQLQARKGDVLKAERAAPGLFGVNYNKASRRYI